MPRLWRSAVEDEDVKHQFQFEAFFISTAHTEDDIERASAANYDALAGQIQVA